MKTSDKNQIKEQLIAYVGRYDSQNEASRSLKGVSSATISQIINNNWELIKDEMWRNIASQIDFSQSQSEWQIVETRDYKLTTQLLVDAQTTSQVYAVTGSAGTGKSTALKLYSANSKRAYMLTCAEYWNKKYFLAELLAKMGRDNTGLTVAEMMQEVVYNLKRRDTPLIILDEADKLTDQVLYFFITLYNELEGHCGVVLFGTEHLAKRIKKGVRMAKKGYEEIYSRLGRKFVELHGLGYTDCVQICCANGIEDKSTIKQVFDDCEGDIRRVKRKIHAVKLMLNQQKAA